MGPFNVNNTFSRHLGRHLVCYKLPKDVMIIQIHYLLAMKEQFRNDVRVIWVHFMLITRLVAILDAILISASAQGCQSVITWFCNVLHVCILFQKMQKHFL